MPESTSEMRLTDRSGNRLYLDAGERLAFLAAAREQEHKHRTFCETLFFTGCRLSEALEITPKRIEIRSRQIILRSLKKRRDDIYRSIPVPADYLDTLDMVHNIRQSRRRPKYKDVRLWSWCSVQAWRIVKGVNGTGRHSGWAAPITQGPPTLLRCPRLSFQRPPASGEIELDENWRLRNPSSSPLDLLRNLA